MCLGQSTDEKTHREVEPEAVEMIINENVEVVLKPLTDHYSKFK